MPEKNISNMNGKEVKQLLKDMVDGKIRYWEWKKGRQYRLKFKGNTIVIKPYPTDRQPGNGFVTFVNERGDRASPRWNDLYETLQDPRFPAYYRNFLANSMSELGNVDVTQSRFFQAAFLLNFEVARRVELNSDIPDRDETEKAIKKSLQTKQYLNLMFMFWHRDFKDRRESFNKVMGQNNEVDLLSWFFRSAYQPCPDFSEVEEVDDEEEDGNEDPSETILMLLGKLWSTSSTTCSELWKHWLFLFGEKQACERKRLHQDQKMYHVLRQLKIQNIYSSL